MDNIFPNNISNLKLIGSGGYGNVYDSGKNYVIKELHTINKDRLDDKRLNKYDDIENPYRELYIHKLLNRYKKSKQLLNVPYLYSYKFTKDKILYAIEKYDGNLNSIINKLNFKKLKSIFFQILFTFNFLQDKLNFFQGDCNFNNMLYKIVSKKNISYNVNGTIYEFCNDGIMVAVSDFGNTLIKNFEYNSEETEMLNRINPKNELYQIIDMFCELLKEKYIKIKENNDTLLNNIFGSKINLSKSDEKFITDVFEYVFENIKYKKLYQLDNNKKSGYVTSDYQVDHEIQKNIDSDNMFKYIFSDYIKNNNN